PRETATTIEDLQGTRIATSYAGLLTTWLADKSIDATVVRLDGAVENAVALGVADAVADVVATGTTLRRAGLEIIGEPLIQSEAIVVSRNADESNDAPSVQTFLRRLHGVMVARSYVLVDYDIPNDRLEQACAVTPGIESPTVSPLHDQSWSAVRAMVPSVDAHTVMDELYELGARGILVTDIHACRL
ncbi:MAG: ATP phosphoribosyltransferase, partial [Actinomycetota bacterium]